MRLRAKVIVAALVMIPAVLNARQRIMVRRVFKSWRYRKLRFLHL